MNTSTVKKINMMLQLREPSQQKRTLTLVNWLFVLALIALLFVPHRVSAAPNDFNLDGKSDLILGNTSGLVDALLMNGTGPASRATIMNDAGWTVTHIADFNGDGKADILWRHTDGSIAMWLMNGSTFTSGAGLLGANSGWSVIQTADFNGDGKADILFRHTDGSVAMWLMNGTTLISGAGLLGATSGWSVTNTGDFNGDGKADILFSHTDGRIAMWLMNGTTLSSGAGLLGAASGWSVANTGDFNGDGKADILFSHTDGRIAMWLMNGTALTSGGGLLGAASGWNVTHTSDFNGDGRADILFRHTDGRIAMWLMNGAALTSGAGLLEARSGWSATHTADFNGDGRADIVFRHTDGRIAIWLMDGTALISGAGLTVAASGWQVMPSAVVAATPVDSAVVAAINTADRAAVLAAYQSIYIPTRAAPLAISGFNVSTCAAGDTTLAYKTSAIRMVNYYRAMSGVPGNVTLNLAWSAKAQQAALMMNANGQLNHTPPSTWTCYSPAGAEAAGHSNLAGGASALGGYYSAMDLYMSDNGVPSLGHRRWVIYPPQAEMGTGDVNNNNSLWVLGPFGTRPATPNGVAWPPAGFVPYPLAPASMTWSFSMANANFANAIVNVGKVGGAPVPITVSVTPSGYGDETIAFTPTAGTWPYAASGDTSFDVQVNGVVVNGASRSFAYRVTLISAP